MSEMKIGLAAPFGNTTSRDIDFLVDYAQAIENIGFNSLWLPEHVVFFDAEYYESKYPYSEGGEPPWKNVTGVFDPLLLAAVAARATTTLRFSTSVLILPQRPALLTAKEVMTLDHIAKGRFDFGVGGGWSSEEYQALGVPFARRGKRFDECIEAIKAVWASESASYGGEFITFEQAVMLPQPYTKGGPPFLIGGDSEAAMKRAARIGDGWYGWWANYELEPHLAKLRGYLAEHGREEGVDFQLKLGIPFKGGPDDLPAKIEEARRLGVAEFVLSLPISSKNLDADLELWSQAAGF